jgi:hypothetical protein
MKVELKIAVLPMILAATSIGCTHNPELRFSDAQQEITRVFTKPLNEVWQTGIVALTLRSFVIQRVDPSAAVLEASYGGDAQSYVDCGELEAVELGAHSGRSYRFPAVKAIQHYQVLRGGSLASVRRRVSLQADIRLTFETLRADLTRVRAKVQYLITQNVSQQSSYEDTPDVTTDTLSFSSGQRAFMPDAGGGTSLECNSTGRLERDALAALGD